MIREGFSTTLSSTFYIKLPFKKKRRMKFFEELNVVDINNQIVLVSKSFVTTLLGSIETYKS